MSRDNPKSELCFANEWRSLNHWDPEVPKKIFGAKKSAPVGHLCGRRTIMYVFMCYKILRRVVSCYR